MGIQEVEVQLPTTSANFRLHAPPVTRRSAQTVRLAGNTGLGTRRSKQPNEDDISY